MLHPHCLKNALTSNKQLPRSCSVCIRRSQRSDLALAEGLGDAPHQLTSYHKMTDSGVLGGSKALSVQDPEVLDSMDYALQECRLWHLCQQLHHVCAF